MGKLPLGVTISAALHATLVAWVATRELTRAPARRDTTDRMRDARDDDRMRDARDADRATTPIEVVVVPPAIAHEGSPPATARTTAAVPSTARDIARGTAAAPSTARDVARGTAAVPSTARDIARGTAAASSAAGELAGGTSTVDPTRGTTGAQEPSRGTRSPYLDMRRGERPDLTLPATRDDLDRVPAGTSPVAGERTGKLAPDGRGRKSDQGSFVAKVDADGDVTVKDRRDFSIRWAVPTPKQIGRGIAEWYESDKGPDGKRGKQTLKDDVSFGIDRPTVGCDGARDAACAPDRTPTVIIPVFRGGFNPTDWIMRRTVGDPYASKKRAFLDETREERAEMRAKHRASQLEQTAMIVRANLERAWGSTADAAVRKQLLFELWDEIVEPADEDSALARASRAARAQVIGFVRARLPQRDRDAYTAEELAALNARRKSSATFSPYE